MKVLYAACVAIALSTAAVAAQSGMITLNTAVSIASYTPVSLTIAVQPSASIQVVITGTDGRRLTFDYPCYTTSCPYNTPATVAALITALNTTNLSTRSLWQRVFDRLILDFPAQFPGGATVQ